MTIFPFALGVILAAVALGIVTFAILNWIWLALVRLTWTVWGE